MPRHNHLAHLACNAQHTLIRRAAVSHCSGRPLAATDRLVRALRPCAVSLCLQAPQPTPRRLVPLLVPGCRPPRQARLDNAGRYQQDLPLGERRRLSLPCRRHWRRAWHHTSLCPVSMVRPMCRHARPVSRGVQRSIGQSAAQCQKQKGTFRGVSGAYHTRVAQHARVPPSIGRSYTLLQHTRDGLRTPDDRSQR